MIRLLNEMSLGGCMVRGLKHFLWNWLALEILGVILEVLGRHWGFFGGPGGPFGVILWVLGSPWAGLGVPVGTFGAQSPPKTDGVF